MNSKTIILSVLLLSFFMTTDAQEETISNPYSVGGLINFNINTFVPTSTTSFAVSPSYSFLINPYFGKIIKENLFLGLELDYNKRECPLLFLM